MQADANNPAAITWSSSQRHFALLLLSITAFFNAADRQIISILIEPIKAEFGTSDTAIGLLTGSVFATFYCLASLPLARLADKNPRRLVISACLGGWSLLTVLGGFATTIGQLALTRIGVALGEAGSGPASYASITDLYPLAHRAKALAIFAASMSLGIGATLGIGGLLVDSYGWRMTLVVVGIPGLLLSLIILRFFREPERGMSDQLSTAASEASFSLREVLAYLWKLRSYRFAVLVAAFGGVNGYGLLFWGPSFMIRIHGMTASAVGMIFGAVTLTALMGGQLVTGYLADLAGRRDIRAYLWFAAGGCLLAAPFGLVFAFASDTRLAIISYGLMSFLMAAHYMCATVVTQTLVPPRMRAMSATILTLTLSIAGMGIAPLLIGGLNDLLAARLGAEAIRYSLTAAISCLVLAGCAALAATSSVREDLAALNGPMPTQPN